MSTGRRTKTAVELNREDAHIHTHRSGNATATHTRGKQRALVCSEQSVLFSHPDFFFLFVFYLTRPLSSWCEPCALCALRSQPAPRVTVAPVTSRLRQVIHALRIRSGRWQPEPTGCPPAWTVGSVLLLLPLFFILFLHYITRVVSGPHYSMCN